jgi:hypothetical protein
MHGEGWNSSYKGENMIRTTITAIGTGMPSADIRNHRFWKKATTVTACISVVGVPLIIAAVALDMPKLALAALAAFAAFVLSRRERDELSKMLKIRFTAAMNLHCGPDDEPYRYSRTGA